MADMQKPISNYPAQPAKKGGGAKKFFLIVLVGVAGAAGASLWWHGKQLGEAKAKAEGKPVSDAKTVPPWDWSSDDWRSWYGGVEATVENTATKAADRAAALKQKLADWQASRTSAAQPTGTPPAEAKPATPDATPVIPATTPDATPVAPAATPNTAASPEGYEDAAKLLDEGKDAWEKHDFPAAKPKLLEAQKLLKPLAGTKHPLVSKALELANGLLEDIEMNSPK